MSSPSWFSRRLLPWYRQHRRQLPWRGTREPYRIWLSEVILQQTRVDQGLGYYIRFTERWPTVEALAGAKEDEVLKLWQGLGYYSRARNLLFAARQVVQEYSGQFPEESRDLLRLRGVGDYTASAIASICFHRPEAVVDGNVYRVLARFAGIDTPIDTAAGRTQFKRLATELLDPDDPGDHNQAVMELGATMCTPRDPQCPICPLRERCAAYATGRQAALPVKQGRTSTRDRFFNYLHIATSTGLYMQQRGPGDIWQGLYELPMIESARPLSQRALLRRLDQEYPAGWTLLERADRPRHVLSHQVIHAVFWKAGPPKGFLPPAFWKHMSFGDLHHLAVPRLIESWLEHGPT